MLLIPNNVEIVAKSFEKLHRDAYLNGRLVSPKNVYQIEIRLNDGNPLKRGPSIVIYAIWRTTQRGNSGFRLYSSVNQGEEEFVLSKTPKPDVIYKPIFIASLHPGILETGLKVDYSNANGLMYIVQTMLQEKVNKVTLVARYSLVLGSKLGRKNAGLCFVSLVRYGEQIYYIGNGIQYANTEHGDEEADLALISTVEKQVQSVKVLEIDRKALPIVVQSLFSFHTLYHKGFNF